MVKFPRTAVVAASLLAPAAMVIAETATGVVYHDRNGNALFEEIDTPLAGVRVSNGRDVVVTDGNGRYSVDVDEDDVVFVIKPRGFRTVLDEKMIPRFYYVHKPAGSPPNLKYPGVAPTGPLPESIDFALYPQSEPEEFRAILFGDPQPRNLKEVEYIGHDVVEELIGFDASFGVSLGDVMFDNLSLYDDLNERIALIGIPWYNVLGNHDLNFDTPNDSLSDETWERVYGPPYYAFDHGPVHFVVLDNVDWQGWNDEDKGSNYRGGLGSEQVEFVRNNLELVPQDKLVVLLMHIPLTNVRDRQDLYRLIENRPFCMSVSGHTHYQEHRFITSEDGWRGAQPHHHLVNVTVSGSWWSGAPDEVGIPHTTMRDGAPNGYSIVTFDGSDYSIDFKAARRPADYQMNIYAPESVSAAAVSTVEIFVNVFTGSEKSTVEMSMDNRSWIPMEQVRREDPYYAELKVLEEEESPPGRKLPRAVKSSHLWTGTLPPRLTSGVYTIKVRSTDMFGKTHRSERIIAVE